MSTETSTRPFRVGDQIRVTPRTQDDVSGPWTILGFVEVESGNHIMHLVATGGTLRSVIIMNPERTAAARDAYTIELLTPAEPSPTPQDHGPLAAPLSDRTLAKVLSRPAHVPLSEMKSTRVFGFNVVTISPQGIPGGPRLDGVVSRQRAQDELDELEPFMVDGWKTVMVELREVVS